MLVLGHWFKSKEVCLCFVSLLTIVLKWALAEANQSGSVPCDGQSQHLQQYCCLHLRGCHFSYRRGRGGSA